MLALVGFAAHAFFGYNVLLGYAVWSVLLSANPRLQHRLRAVGSAGRMALTMRNRTSGAPAGRAGLAS